MVVAGESSKIEVKLRSFINALRCNFVAALAITAGFLSAYLRWGRGFPEINRN